MRKINSPLLGPMLAFAHEFLDELPLISVQEFEQALFDEFHEQWEVMRDQDMAGRSRKRWENLTDWIKAYLTQGQEIKYLSMNGKRYIAYTPTVGTVKDIGAISMHRQVRYLLDLIQKENL